MVGMAGFNLSGFREPRRLVWITAALGFLFAFLAGMAGHGVLSNILLFYASLVLLVESADFLVSGSSRIAKYFGVSTVVIGITVVAFGTSLPELTVSIIANLVGSTGIAIGNVVGSNISNICLVLGLAALLVPIEIKRELFRFDVPFLLGVSLLLFMLSMRVFDFTGSGYAIGLIDGVIMLMLFLLFMYVQVSGVHPHDRREHSARERRKLPGYILLVLAGLAGVIISAGLLVESGRSIARFFGVPEVIIGLTVIAVGTSLPELATNMVAAAKRKFGIAIGNIIGSNIFNILLVVGATSVVKPVQNMAESAVLVDMPIMIGLTVLLFFLMRTGLAITRRDGILLVSLYIIYIFYLFMRMA
jgi:cation:H+ antiporter